jgi:hypothetical protein
MQGCFMSRKNTFKFILFLAFSPFVSLHAEEMQSFSGWSLTENEPEENTYAKEYSLRPWDGRSVITLDEAAAYKIKKGVISPAAYYAERVAGAKETPTPAPAVQPPAADPNLAGTFMSGKRNTAATDTAVSGAIFPTWNPDGQSKPYYSYEDAIAACSPIDGSHKTEDARTKDFANFFNYKFKDSNICKNLDVVEEVKRSGFDFCTGEGGTKEAWAMGPDSHRINGRTAILGQGILTCNSGRAYHILFELKQYKGECWICGFDGAFKENIMTKIDLTTKPRTSPHESEAPTRESYWK